MKNFWLRFYFLLILLPSLLGFLTFKMANRPERLSAYLAKDFALRRWMNQLNTRLQVDLLKGKNLGNVHLGRGDWLFYMSRTDGNVVDDFMGVPHGKVIKPWRTYMEKSHRRAYCTSAPLLFVSPPNKETVYTDKTSYHFTSMLDRRSGNFARVLTFMEKEYPDHVVNVLPTLLAKRTEHETYYRMDTHWNEWGSYWAHREILPKAARLLKIEIVPKEIAALRTDGFEGEDILAMLKTQGYERPSLPATRIQLHQEDYVGSVTLEKNYSVYTNARGQKLVWIVGDSFREALKFWLPQYFAKTIFIFRPTYSTLIQRALKEHGPPDLIIEEVVERALSGYSIYPDCADSPGLTKERGTSIDKSGAERPKLRNNPRR